jgi:hypothetical protein
MFQLCTSACRVQVNEQYARDIARVHGSAPREDEEYRNFMRELGGAPPPELMGHDDGRRDPGEQGSRAAGQHHSLSAPLCMKQC